jgi:hypothetical protein
MQQLSVSSLRLTDSSVRENFHSEVGYFLNLLDNPFETIKKLDKIRSCEHRLSGVFQVRYSHGFGPFFELSTQCFPFDRMNDSHDFDIDLTTVKWIERADGVAKLFTATTEGAVCDDLHVLSQYLEGYWHGQQAYGCLLDMAKLYDGESPFVQEILQAIILRYRQKHSTAIAAAFQLFITYTLSQSLTTLLPSEGSLFQEITSSISRPDQPRYNDQALAPAVVQLQIRMELTVISRRLHEQALKELNCLYAGVYGGLKLRDYDQIFAAMLILMIVWRRIQFDSFELSEVFLCSQLLTKPVSNCVFSEQGT